MIDVTTIPEMLCARTQWICWRSEERNGKQTKIPIDPKTGSFASSTDDQTWSTLEDALEYRQSGNADGVGFVFTEDDPIVGIDLDNCRDTETGQPDPEAKAIVKRLDSYTEVSPSGTGYHVLVLGELPKGRNRRGNIEIYDHARFFTVTGDRVSGTPAELTERQIELDEIYETHIETSTPSGPSGSSPSRSQSNPSNTLSNDELLEKARNASNGPKFDRLWNGNTAGYESQSEADMALCCLLAFWTGGDQLQIDELFRKSSLYREKWDEVHYADGSTYGEKTAERAIDQVSEFYEPPETERTSVQSTAGQKVNITKTRTDRSQIYLEKKTQILTDRVTELEQVLERKNERIRSLEAALDEVQTQVVDQRPSIEDAENSRTSVTIWSRIKRLI